MDTHFWRDSAIGTLLGILPVAVPLLAALAYLTW
jgi:hypothetical protein